MIRFNFLKVCLIIFLGSANVFGQVQKKYIEIVDLSADFPNKVVKQESPLCHIHAAVSLLENWCARKTRRRIKLSDAFFAYRYLRVRLNRIVDFKSMDTKTRDFYDWWYLLEEGTPRETFQRFKHGQSSSESEFPLEKLDQIESAISRFHIDEEETLVTLKREIDEIFIEGSKQSGQKMKHNWNGGFETRSNDPDILDCMKYSFKIEIRRDFDAKAVISKLRSKIPVLAETPFGDLDKHGFVLLGFRSSEKEVERDLNVEYLVRDSATGTQDWQKAKAYGPFLWLH